MTMMRRSKALIGIMVVISLSTLVWAQLINNPVFDTTVGGWTLAGGTGYYGVCPYDYDTAGGSVRVSNYNFGTDIKLQHIVNLIPNTSYTLTWWAKPGFDYGFTGPNVTEQIHVWGSQTGTQIGQYGYTTGTYSNPVWAKFSYTFNSGNNVTAAIQFTGNSSDYGFNYIDDASLTPTASPGQEMFTNGDFRGDFLGWTVAGASPPTYQPVDHNTGSVTVFNYYYGGDIKLQQSSIPVVANTNYTLTWWAKPGFSQGFTGPTVVEQVHIWGEQTGTQVGNPGYTTGTYSDPVWGQYSCTFNSGNNISVAIQFTGASVDAGFNYIDRVEMVKANASGSNLIKNGTFKGDAAGWTLVGTNTAYHDTDHVTGSVYVYNYNGGTNTKLEQQVAVTENTAYKLTWSAYPLFDGGFAGPMVTEKVQIYGVQSGTLLRQQGYQVGTYSQPVWTQHSTVFNSGTNTQVFIDFVGADWDWGVSFVDNVRLAVDNPIAMPCASWYDNYIGPDDQPDSPNNPTEIFNAGGKYIVLHQALGFGFDPSITNYYNYTRAYLDSAYARGLGVILGLEISIKNVPDSWAESDWTPMTRIVQAYGDHPAVIGFMTVDEPNGAGAGMTVVKAAEAKTRIRAIDSASKPIYMGFGAPDSTLSDYAATYDIAIWDYYPSYPDWVEFEHWADCPYPVDTPDSYTSWQFVANAAVSQAAAAGRPLHVAIQAHGIDYGPWRLPSYNEERFMVFFSLIKGVAGIEFWNYYALTECSPARTGTNNPYKADGDQWLVDVMVKPASSVAAQGLAAELNYYGPIIKNYKITSGVSDNKGTTGTPPNDLDRIACAMYHDSAAGDKHYIVAINTTSVSQSNVRFTINHSGSSFTSAARISPTSGAPRTITHGSTHYFTDTVPAFGVYIYELTPQPLVRMNGDANLDGKVDVGDLGILAANYGATGGATWEMGDFNSDGNVDVGDLGILAAAYGTGTQALLDFNKDVSAIGLAIGDEKLAVTQTEESPVISTLGCGLVDLFMIAGILLAAFCHENLKVWDV